MDCTGWKNYSIGTNINIWSDSDEAFAAVYAFMLLCLCVTMCFSQKVWSETLPAPIIGGSMAANGQFPYQIFLINNTPAGAASCGATLIATDWVLTAAHCVVDRATAVTSLPGDLECWIGVTDLNARVAGDLYTVDQIIVHPSYNTTSLTYDYALLHISKHAVGTDIKPIELAPQDDPAGLAVAGEAVQLSGWGITSAGAPAIPTDLMYVDTNVLLSSDHFNGRLLPNMIAIGTITGPTAPGGACQGDSGGPAVVKDLATGNLVEVGITSWGAGTCTAIGSPAVYARVSSVRSWIDIQTDNFLGFFIDDYPTIKITTPTLASSTTETITIDFSEDMQNISIANFSVDSGTLNNFTAVSAAQYTVDYLAPVTEGVRTITFTPVVTDPINTGTDSIDVDDSLPVHWTEKDILVDDDIVTLPTGLIAVGISLGNTRYALPELGFGGMSLREYDPISSSYIIPTQLDGTKSYWLNAATAPKITAPNEQTSAITYVNLYAGWNFFSISSHTSVTWSTANIQVRHNGTTYSLLQAQLNGMVEDYAWHYDSNTSTLISVNDVAHGIIGSGNTLSPWEPYWFKALVDGCELVIPASAAVPVYAQAVKEAGAFPLALLGDRR
ncbi:MAG: serine protease [Planctomycetes bacterium]|nr:serine protease [Planctomycetota bacterium]